MPRSPSRVGRSPTRADRGGVGRPQKAVELAGAERVLEAARGGGRTDMVSHEVLGGHTIAKHVGPPRDLRERLKADRALGAASCYPSVAAANRVVTEVMNGSRATIRDWLADASRTRPLTIKATMSSDVGYVLPRGGSLVKSKRTMTVLVKAVDAPDGFYVLTSFPMKDKP